LLKVFGPLADIYATAALVEAGSEQTFPRELFGTHRRATINTFGKGIALRGAPFLLTVATSRACAFQV
jgi:hypothetical protein